VAASPARSPAANRPEGRKVRAPPGRVLGNTQEGRPYGECHRNHTARGRRICPPGDETPVKGWRLLARVKWCGKSAPAVG
jgi:hypothetical protein